MTSSKANYLTKVPFPNTTTLELGLQHRNRAGWGGGGDTVQFTAGFNMGKWSTVSNAAEKLVQEKLKSTHWIVQCRLYI